MLVSGNVRVAEGAERATSAGQDGKRGRGALRCRGVLEAGD